MISLCSSEEEEEVKEYLSEKQICFLEKFKKKNKLWEEVIGDPTPLLISLIRDLIRDVAEMQDMYYIQGNLNPETVVIITKGEYCSRKNCKS